MTRPRYGKCPECKSTVPVRWTGWCYQAMGHVTGNKKFRAVHDKPHCKGGGRPAKVTQ